jgi:hypothetical protein
MADFDGDANATPLAKLAPAILQSKQQQIAAGGGGGGGGMNEIPQYAEMMKAAQQGPPLPTIQDTPRPDLLHQMHQVQHQMYNEPYAPPQQPPPQFMPPPVYDQPAHHHQRRVRFADEDFEPEEPARKRRRARDAYAPFQSGPVAPWWHKYKPGLLVAAIVFVMLVYGVPRIKTSVPYVLSPTGKLNAVGLGAVALLCGALYQGGSRFVV